MFKNQILLHLLLQNKLTTSCFGFTILILITTFYFHKSNFKLHFIIWVLPINTHQASSLTILLPVLSCTTQFLLPDYFQPLHYTMQDNSLNLYTFHSQHQAIHTYKHNSSASLHINQLILFIYFPAIPGYTTSKTIVLHTSELHSIRCTLTHMHIA
jgi:hypothetical protein